MFRERLNTIMKAQNISGKELSQSTGICESTISKFLCGKQEPKYSQIIKIAEGINLTPTTFMSVISPQFEIIPPMINEYCLIQEIFKDESSGLQIIVFQSFKKFIADISNMINDKSIYISFILEGKIDSKLGTLRAGDYRILKGVEYKGVNTTVHKGTKCIVYSIYDTTEDPTKRWSSIFFNSLTD